MHPNLNEWLWRLAFFMSVLFALVMASLPSPNVPGNPPEMLLHAGAFFALTILAQLAFPRAKTWLLLLGLSALGAGIELIQSIPLINRDASFTDWLVDMIAIGVASSVFRAACWLFADQDLAQDQGV